jgi:hypothetical protein
MATAQTQAAPTIPNAPTSLTGEALSSDQVRLTWSDNSSNETGFQIERSTNGRTFSVVGTVGADVKSFTDGTVKQRTEYIYRIRAVGAAGVSAPSNLATVTTPRKTGPGGAALPNAETTSPGARVAALAQELAGRIALGTPPKASVHLPELSFDRSALLSEAIDRHFSSIITEMTGLSGRHGR